MCILSPERSLALHYSQSRLKFCDWQRGALIACSDFRLTERHFRRIPSKSPLTFSIKVRITQVFYVWLDFINHFALTWTFFLFVNSMHSYLNVGMAIPLQKSCLNIFLKQGLHGLFWKEEKIIFMGQNKKANSRFLYRTRISFSALHVISGKLQIREKIKSYKT